jgi:hypothetical protein
VEDQGRKVALWIIADIVILTCGPIVHYICLDGLLDYEYATGIRTDTSGDIILIPVIGGFILLFLIVFLINAMALVYVFARRKRTPANDDRF